jgi:hypothetical protein
MFENKRIENPKSHYKLEFDIKTDNENILNILKAVQKIIGDEFNNRNLIAEVVPIITKIDFKEE